MTFYLVEDKTIDTRFCRTAKPVQLLYAPESGLLTKKNKIFHYIPYCLELIDRKPHELSDFNIYGMPKSIFMAEISKKEKLGAKDFRKTKEERLADYFEIGHIASADSSIAEILFLKETLKGRVVDDMLKTVMEENASHLLVEFNERYPNILEMTYIPAEKRE